MDIKPKSLTRKQIKTLRKKGINLLNMDGTKADEIVDAVLDMLYPSKEEQEELDNWEYHKIMGLFKGIIEKTFGSEAIEKN